MFRVIYQNQLGRGNHGYNRTTPYHFYMSTAYTSKSYLKKLILTPSAWGAYNFRHTHTYGRVNQRETILKVVRDDIQR